jgi:hypothetical protein
MNRPLKFLFWPYARKKLLLKVLFSVATIRVRLWLLPFKPLDNQPAGPESAADSRPFDWSAIREITAFVQICSRFIPHASCLTQALATRTLLHGIGQTCVLKIGVDKDEHQKLIAHAWIEVDGKMIIGKIRDIRRYTVMSSSKEQLA